MTSVIITSGTALYQPISAAVAVTIAVIIAATVAATSEYTVCSPFTFTVLVNRHMR